MKIQDAIETIEGPGIPIHRVISPAAPLNPFLMLDDAEIHIPRGEKFPPGPHPHRGFETVTYVLTGTVHHRDSMGHQGSVSGGGVEWMRAGSGLIHGLDGDWAPSPGETIHALQLWVNLPAADKFLAPAFQVTEPDAVPEVEVPGGLVRVVAGEYRGASHRGHTRLPITYLHVRLDEGALELSVAEGHRAFAYVLQGAGTVDGATVQKFQRVELDGNVEVASETGIEFVFLSAVALDEPVASAGPFVMNTRDELVQAFNDFQDGKMGDV